MRRIIVGKGQRQHNPGYRPRDRPCQRARCIGFFPEHSKNKRRRYSDQKNTPGLGTKGINILEIDGDKKREDADYPYPGLAPLKLGFKYGDKKRNDIVTNNAGRRQKRGADHTHDSRKGAPSIRAISGSGKIGGQGQSGWIHCGPPWVATQFVPSSPSEREKVRSPHKGLPRSRSSILPRARFAAT